MSESQEIPTREVLIQMLSEILQGDLPEETVQEYGALIDRHVPHPDVLSLVYPPWLAGPRDPAEVIDEALAYRPVQVDLPLLEQLKRLAEQAGKVFPRLRKQGLSDIGLACFMEELYCAGYGCSAVNSVAFATTGREGNHYSFLVREGRIDEQSPVIFTAPDQLQNVIVGENLYDFLCFGCESGYFGPGQASETSSWFSRRKPSRSGSEPGALNRNLSRKQQQLLQWVSQELSLKPWPEPEQRFSWLQQNYLPQLEIPS